MQSEAEKLLNDADLTARKEELLTCFGCGLKCKDIKKCGGCKLAKYCSQVEKRFLNFNSYIKNQLILKILFI